MYAAESLPSAFLGRTRLLEGHGQAETAKFVAERPVVLANPSAVTIAFRELQNRAKILEAERDGALKEGANLQARIDEIGNGREDRYAARNAARLRATDDLFHIREEGNRLRVHMGEMDTQLVYLDNDVRATQMNLTSDRGTFSVVEDDCVEMRGKILELTSKKELLDKEANTIRNKIESVQSKMSNVPTRNKTQSSRLRATVQRTEEQIRLLRHQMDQQKVQMETVKKYLDMLLDVNDEICDTVMARELARTRTLRLAGRVNLPPNSPDRDVEITAAFPAGKQGSSRKKLGRSTLADGLPPSLKRGSSANNASSATRAIGDLIHRAKEISLSKNQYIKSDIAAAGGYVDNSLPSREDNFDDIDDADDDDDNVGNTKSKSKKGAKAGKKGNNRREVPLNDVMKIINADAVRHALHSQKQRAVKEASDLLEVTSGLGIGYQGGSDGALTPGSRTPFSSPSRSPAKAAARQATAMAKRRRRERQSAATKTPKEAVRKGNEFYSVCGYDSIARAGNAYAMSASRSTSGRPLSAPMTRLSARVGSARKLAGGGSSSAAGGSGITREKEKDGRRFWGPAGKGQTPSENILINRDKVAASKRRHWVDAELNHYWKLHSPGP